MTARDTVLTIGVTLAVTAMAALAFGPIAAGPLLVAAALSLSAAIGLTLRGPG